MPVLRIPTLLLMLLLLSSCQGSSETSSDAEEAAPGEESAEVAASQDGATGQDEAGEPFDPANARPAHWGYGAEDGPARWAELSPSYFRCAEGRSQSPIDLALSKVMPVGPRYKFSHQSAASSISHNEHMDGILDNGHTIQIDVLDGSWVTFDGTKYALKQLHFHTPSEHTLGGKHLPLELHLVHQSGDGKILVGGILFEEGEENIALKPIVQHLPGKPGEQKDMSDVVLDFDALVDTVDTRAFHYSGSLTTPPCGENVEWFVTVVPRHASAEQLAEFSKRLKGNNRPIQPLNRRRVTIAEVR